MQGNEKKSGMVDHGWEQMSAILDREMPVEKRRRKPVVWWFVGIAGIAALFLAGYLATNTGWASPGSDKDKPIAASNERAQIETNIFREEDGDLNYQNRTTGSIENHKSASLANGTETNKTPSGNSVEMLNANVNSAKFAEVTEPGVSSETMLRESTVRNEIPRLEARALHPLRKTRDLLYPVESITSITRKHQASENLYVPDIKRLSTDAQKSFSGASISAKPVSVKDHKVGFRAYAGGLKETMSSFAGAKGGFGIQIPAAKSFSINAGLEYHYLTRTGLGGSSSSEDSRISNNPGLFQGNPIVNSPTLIGSNVFLEVDDIKYSEQIQHMHFISLPVGVEYRVHPRWGLNAGIAVAYLASAALSEVYTVDFTEESTVDMTEYYRLNPSTTDGLNLWDIQMDVGIRYYLSRRFDVTLSYRHGFISVIGETGDLQSLAPQTNKVVELAGTPGSDYTRFISVELGYRF